MEWMRYILIVCLFILQMVVGVPSWLTGTDSDYICRALSYSFFHANWAHLLLNCIAVWMVFSPRRRWSMKGLLVAYLIAVVVYPCSFRPVIGFSNILYAGLGMRSPSLRSPWWKNPSTMTFIMVTLAMAFIPQIAATTHIISFLLGMLYASFKRWTDKLLKDARRYY